VFGGRRVDADPARTGDMLGGGLQTWDDPLVASVLSPARENPNVDESQRALLPWALTTLSAANPSSLGLVGPASYSGPGATALVGNLLHSSRAGAFAAELITAAALVYRTWPSTDGAISIGGLRHVEARLDFGVKLLGAATGRRTAEADILVSSADGSRAAIDVKFSRSGVYRAVPPASMLDVLERAIDRGEIAGCHFVTPGRFRPAVHRSVRGREGVHLHEHVWPSQRDRCSIALQERAALDYASLLRASEHGAVLDFDGLTERLASGAIRAYRNATAGEREIVEIRTESGLTYLFDKTASPPAEAEPRLIAGWGRSSAAGGSRDRRFMAGFPLPRSETPLDRGHLIARAAGGDEGIGLNLIPQDRRLNRGLGPDGRRWRRLERLAVSTAGTGVFVRALYDDLTAIPVRLDYVVVGRDGEVVLERFRNRPDSP
jgi:hypothetical protein